MTRLRRALLPALLLALVPAVPTSAAPSSDRFGDPVLLALGDSVAAGVGAVPYVTGYPELTAAELERGYHPKANKVTRGRTTDFDVMNVAVPGATTLDLVAQVDRAVRLIEARRSDRDPKNDVEVITLTIGGNDVFTPVLAACLVAPDPRGCEAVTSTQLTQVRANVEDALRRLVAAAGKHTEIVVTTYYNSLVAACPRLPDSPVVGALAARLAEVVLEGGTFGAALTLQDGLDDVIRQVADETGVQVAELYGVLGPDELVGDCLHPNAAGHADIAEVVSDTLAG